MTTHIINIGYEKESQRSKAVQAMNRVEGETDLEISKLQGTTRLVQGEDIESLLNELSLRRKPEDINLYEADCVDVEDRYVEEEFTYEIGADPETVEEQLKFFYSKVDNQLDENRFMRSDRELGNIIYEIEVLGTDNVSEVHTTLSYHEALEESDKNITEPFIEELDQLSKGLEE